MVTVEADPTSTLPAPSHPFVTFEDHTSLLNVIGWFSVVVVVLIVFARLGMRWAKSRTVGLDDGAIIISTIIALAQTTVVSFGVTKGLGRSARDVANSELVAQQKTIYAFLILFIFGQFFAKLSIIGFVMTLTPYRPHRVLSWCFVGAACIWIATSVLGFTFQCEAPYTWKFVNHKCIGRVAFYTFVEVFNIVLDTALAFFPSYIIIGLQLDSRRKAITIGFFMSRLFVVAASVSQLVVIYTRTEDPFLSWTFALLVTIIQTLGIVTACGPYLKPFLDSVSSGMIGNDDIRRRQGGTVTGYYKYPSSEGLKKSKISAKLDGLFAITQKNLRNTSKHHEGSELDIMNRYRRQSRIGVVHEAQVSGTPHGEMEEWEVGSQSSRARIIRQTTTYRVSLETGG